jgi:hypothetical protein
MRNALIGAGIVIAIVVTLLVGVNIGKEEKGPGEELGQALDNAITEIEDGLQKASE